MVKQSGIYQNLILLLGFLALLSSFECTKYFSYEENKRAYCQGFELALF